MVVQTFSFRFLGARGRWDGLVYIVSARTARIHRETLSPKIKKGDGGRCFLWVFSICFKMLQSSLLHSDQTVGWGLLDKDIIVDKAMETWDQLPY